MYQKLFNLKCKNSLNFFQSREDVCAFKLCNFRNTSKHLKRVCTSQMNENLQLFISISIFIRITSNRASLQVFIEISNYNCNCHSLELHGNGFKLFTASALGARKHSSQLIFPTCNGNKSIWWSPASLDAMFIYTTISSERRRWKKRKYLVAVFRLFCEKVF